MGLKKGNNHNINMNILVAIQYQLVAKTRSFYLTHKSVTTTSQVLLLLLIHFSEEHESSAQPFFYHKDNTKNRMNGDYFINNRE